MPEGNMTWHKHGDILVGEDRHGYRRAFLWQDDHIYIAVVNLLTWTEISGPNKKKLCAECVRKCREYWGSQS